MRALRRALAYDTRLSERQLTCSRTHTQTHHCLQLLQLLLLLSLLRLRCQFPLLACATSTALAPTCFVHQPTSKVQGGNRLHSSQQRATPKDNLQTHLLHCLKLLQLRLLPGLLCCDGRQAA